MSSGSAPLPRGLCVAALGLAALAVILALVVPGLIAPRPVMVQRSHGGPATIGTACTTYVGSEVTLQAPGRGTVVVSATVGVGISHAFGYNDEARIVIATAATDCTLNNYTAFVSIPRTVATDPFHFVTVPVLRTFSVSGAASLTFHVNGVMFSGGDVGDRFDSASVVAVFYPS